HLVQLEGFDDRYDQFHPPCSGPPRRGLDLLDCSKTKSPPFVITADAALARCIVSPARPRYRRRFRDGACEQGFGNEMGVAPKKWASGVLAATEFGVFGPRDDRWRATSGFA
ncbi:MAG: hypothetical protein ACOVOE_00470, partial [Caulobacter sp.]